MTPNYFQLWHKKPLYMPITLSQDIYFLDGNKRTGMHCAILFLKLNGCSLRLGIDDSIIELGLGNGAINDIEVIADHLRSWLEPKTDEGDTDEANKICQICQIILVAIHLARITAFDGIRVIHRKPIDIILEGE